MHQMSLQYGASKDISFQRAQPARLLSIDSPHICCDLSKERCAVYQRKSMLGILGKKKKKLHTGNVRVYAL